MKRLLICYLCFSVSAACLAQGPTTGNDTWNIHFQATSIGQQHGAFPALYEGAKHWDFVINPEVAGGRGFGYVTGIAGFTNGEIPRVSSAMPTLYAARAYARYTIPLGPETEMVENSPNQPSGALPVERLSLVTGKFAMTDFFDNNSYSHDPRSQFMNWSLMYNGAWDYPADTRGYTRRHPAGAAYADLGTAHRRGHGTDHR
jgi:high affinity Mn2+ porin